MFKKYLTIFSIITMFLLSGCQIYEDIYGQSDVSTISLDEIAVEGGEEIEEVEEIEREIVDVEMEDIDMSEVDEEAALIIVQETDLVSLEPAANDPDGDPLIYTFTSPLDESGEWQTTYGDEGEYTVTITASDGDLSASKDVLIIVNRKEEAPVIDFSTPENIEIDIDENNVLEFSVSASDLNSDILDYGWKVDGETVSTDTYFTYNINYDAAGSHTVKLSITDGTLETTKIWAIDVENVNRPPEMADLENVGVRESEPVIIAIEAADPDGDGLTFTIDNANFEQEGNVFTWVTTYDDSGIYDVTITTSDGDLSVSQQIQVEVENVNRAPVFLGIQQR